MEKLNKKYTNLIVLLQSFEVYWNFYSLSEGELYYKQAKGNAIAFVECMNEIYLTDNEIYNSKSITYNSTDNEDFARYRLNGIKDWATSDKLFPFSEIGFSDNEASRVMLQPFFMCLTVYLCSKLNLEKFPMLANSNMEATYSKNYMMWMGHLPWQAINIVDNNFVEELSRTDSIVLVADIRKSQDLMTYSPNADFFRDKTLEFITKMRKIIKSNYGIFDKFTGDGFLCYFNDSLCKRLGKDYYKQMMKSCQEIMCFSTTFFNEWIKHIRKLPPNSSGLTLGIDSGVVKFKNLENHLFAIGDAIVWANRMSSIGKKEEIILNNIPYHKVKEFTDEINFETIESTTKGGEGFTAYKLKLPIKINNDIKSEL